MGKHFSILAVDDNINNLAALAALFEYLPEVEFIQAISGEKALETCLLHEVHLILLDVQMPGMDGFETAKHLQMIGRTRNIPIVFLTAVFKSETFIQNGYSIGAVDYLTKPIEDSMLLNRVRHYQHLRTRELELQDRSDHLEILTKQLEQTQMLLVRKVRERTADLQLLLDAATDFAIISIDKTGRITTFNRGAELMLGYTEREVLGRTPEMWHREHEINECAMSMSKLVGYAVEGMQVFMEGALNQGANGQTWTFVRKDGKTLQVSLVVNVVYSEEKEVVGFLGIARDISAQLIAEEKLNILNQQLDQRVQERTEQLQRALQNLQQLQEKVIQSEKLSALGFVVTAVAHELNTPLGNCLTVSSTIEDNANSLHDLLNSNQPMRRGQLEQYISSTQAAMNLLQRGLQRAIHLVNSFKRIASLSENFAWRKFILDEEINRIINVKHTDASVCSIDWQLDIPEQIEMESYPEALEQILLQLIENSILHGFLDRPSGIIKIVAYVDKDVLNLMYSDDGCGMNLEVAAHIFDPFFTTKLGQGSSGLGMNICYNLVTGPLGGSIEVSSELNKGTFFQLLLPLKAAEATRLE
jgi:PAS domain S-box-containing protein